MTAGLTGITVNTALQQSLPGRFLLTVLESRGDTAVILANGKTLEVQSEIPLQPGQTLFVSQEQGTGGQVRLRVIRDLDVPETAGLQAAPGGKIDLQTALYLAELPATAEAANKITALLKTLGDLSLPNLLAAVSFLKTGLVSDQVLKALSFFLNSLLCQQEEENTPGATPAGADGAQLLKQLVLDHMQGLAEALQQLSSHPDVKQSLGGLLQELALKSGEPGSQALGGQVYTWTQTEQEGHYFYLPLYTTMNNFGLHNCELYIYPPAAEQKDQDDQAPWLFTLTLETDTLGWMQFRLACQNRQVAVQALVEQPGTKLALDDHWPLLAAGLSGLNLKLASQQCALGRVHSQARSVHDLGLRFQQYNPFDISI